MQLKSKLPTLSINDHYKTWQSLGAFAKFRSDFQLRHIRSSVRMEQVGSLWTDFH